MSFGVVALVDPYNTIAIKLMRCVIMLLCYFFLNYPKSEFIVVVCFVCSHILLVNVQFVDLLLIRINLVIFSYTVLHYCFECSYCFLIMIDFPNHYVIIHNFITRILKANLFLLNIIAVLYHFNCLRCYIVVVFDFIVSTGFDTKRYLQFH